MRLWSLHPSLLDQKGLVALWRESLLAQNVSLGNTKGYKNHPQLIRFKQTNSPIDSIATYLWYIHQESIIRNYKFNANKIFTRKQLISIPVTNGQINYELEHLKKKLIIRDPQKIINEIKIHPMFIVVNGEIEPWEIL